MLRTFIGKRAEQVGANHLHGGLEDALLEDCVGGLGLIKHVNDLDQALFLRFFQLHVLLDVREVRYLVAGLELGEVQDLPLGGVNV